MALQGLRAGLAGHLVEPASDPEPTGPGIDSPLVGGFEGVEAVFRPL